MEENLIGALRCKIDGSVADSEMNGEPREAEGGTVDSAGCEYLEYRLEHGFHAQQRGRRTDQERQPRQRGAMNTSKGVGGSEIGVRGKREQAASDDGEGYEIEGGRRSETHFPIGSDQVGNPESSQPPMDAIEHVPLLARHWIGQVGAWVLLEESDFLEFLKSLDQGAETKDLVPPVELADELADRVVSVELFQDRQRLRGKDVVASRPALFDDQVGAFSANEARFELWTVVFKRGHAG